MTSTLYRYVKARTISRMTLFNPGHNPPQVTIAARTSEGLKCKVDRGPARTNASVEPLPLYLRTISLMIISSLPIILLYAWGRNVDEFTSFGTLALSKTSRNDRISCK
jgi:hypothetical protein